MHLFGLQIVSSIYHKKMRNKEPHRGFWGFIFCIFLVSLLLHTLRRRSLHARKVDTYPFRKFYNFIHYNGCKCISIKPDCLHSCYLQQCTLLFFVWTTEKVKLSLFLPLSLSLSLFSSPSIPPFLWLSVFQYFDLQTLKLMSSRDSTPSLQLREFTIFPLPSWNLKTFIGFS